MVCVGLATLGVVNAPIASAEPYSVGFSVSYDSATDPKIGVDTKATIGTLDVRPGSDGNRVICISSGFNDPKTLTEAGDREDPQLAALFHLKDEEGKTLINTSDPVTAAALAEWTKRRLDDHPAEVDLAWQAFKEQHLDAVAPVEAKIAALGEYASKYTGNYTADPALKLSGTSGSVSSLGVKSGANWLAGYDLSVTLSGPATFENGSTAWRGKTTDSPSNLPIKITGLGEVTVSQKVTDLPGKSYRFYGASDFPASRLQNMVSVNPSSLEANGTTKASVEAVKPQLSSSVGAKVYKAGETGKDTVRITAGVPGTTVPVSAVVFGPLQEVPSAVAAQAPKDTPVFDTVTKQVTLDSKGEASVEFTASKPFKAGAYVWQEATAAAGIMEAATSTYGRTAETSIVPNIEVATQVSNQAATVGQELSDAAEVKGLIKLDGVKYVLSGAAYGPVAPIDGKCTGVDWTNAPIAAQIEQRELTENSTLSGLGKFTSKAAGCYTYGESVAIFVNDKLVNQVDHPLGLATQTSLVSAPQGGDDNEGGGDAIDSGEPFALTAGSLIVPGSIVAGGLFLLLGAGVATARVATRK